MHTGYRSDIVAIRLQAVVGFILLLLATFPILHLQAQDQEPKTADAAFFKRWDQLQQQLKHDDSDKSEQDVLLSNLETLQRDYLIPDGLQVGFHTILGDAYQSRFRYSQARDQYRNALLLAEKNLDLRIKLIYAALDANSPGLATEQLQIILDDKELDDWHPWAKRTLQACEWIGKTAPDFTLTDQDGNRVSLRDLRGSVVLLDFWASWAAPWKRQLPHLISLQQRYRKNPGFHLLGISHDKNKETMNAAIQTYDITWQCFWPEAGKENAVSKSFGVSFLPCCIVIDKEGRICWRQSPTDRLPDEMLQSLLENE